MFAKMLCEDFKQMGYLKKQMLNMNKNNNG